MGIKKAALILAGTAFLGASAASAAPVRPAAVSAPHAAAIPDARAGATADQASDLNGGSWALAIAALIAVILAIVIAADGGNGRSPD